MIVINGEVVAQGGQFGLLDVEVVTATGKYSTCLGHWLA